MHIAPNHSTLVRTLTGLLAITLAVMLISTTGCKRMGGVKARLVAKQLAHSVPINGQPITVGQFTAVDVENPWGDVIIDANSKHEYAMVEFRVRKERWARFEMARAGIEFDPVGEWFYGEYITPEDTLNQVGTLVIRPSDLTIDGFRPPVDIKISIPRCDGARVRSTRGKIQITGVSGTVDIENGDDNTPGGEIVIRTSDSTLEEIAAISSQGDVYVVTTPNNAGRFDIRAPFGDAFFRSRYGYMDEVMPEKTRWTGVWNDGSNAIDLQADRGDAGVFVVENPARFKP